MVKYLAIPLLAVSAFAQAPQPALSTADKMAISTAEKSKAEARKAYDEAQAAEAQVVNEWKTAHPGWHLNPQNFSVEPDMPVQPAAKHVPEITPAKPEVKAEPKK